LRLATVLIKAQFPQGRFITSEDIFARPALGMRAATLAFAARMEPVKPLKYRFQPLTDFA